MRGVEALAGAAPVAVGCSVPAELTPAAAGVALVPRVFARRSLRGRYPERGYHTATQCGHRRDGPAAGVSAIRLISRLFETSEVAVAQAVWVVQQVVGKRVAGLRPRAGVHRVPGSPPGRVEPARQAAANAGATTEEDAAGSRSGCSSLDEISS
jgi:hypothetical protein